MNVTIKKVRVGSAFKVGFVLNIILFAIFGLVALITQLLFASAFSAVFRNSTGAFSTFDFNTIGIPILCMGYAGGIVVAGIFGGIGFSIYALVYNIATGMTGGLQVELSRESQ
jgi:hypothetical protein